MTAEQLVRGMVGKFVPVMEDGALLDGAAVNGMYLLGADGGWPGVVLLRDLSDTSPKALAVAVHEATHCLRHKRGGMLAGFDEERAVDREALQYVLHALRDDPRLPEVREWLEWHTREMDGVEAERTGGKNG
jgi:hypothetical protein